MSEIRANIINSEDGTAAVQFPKGQVVTGITTATSFSGSIAATNLTGTIADARFPATLPAVSGANLTSLNAANISSGIITAARLGGGTANATTFLNGNGQYAEAGGGKLLQIKYGTKDGVTSTTSSGNSNSITAGVQLININFTPVSATSKLLLQSSSVCVHEWGSNQGDHYWTSVWNGTTHVGGNESSPDDSLWNNTWGVAWNVIHHVGDSGNTNARDIQLRAGGNGSATKYINGGVTYNQTGIRARIGFTVMEYEP